MTDEVIDKNILAFCGGHLDRAGNHRADRAWLDAHRAAGLVLPFFQGRPLVERDTGKRAPLVRKIARPNKYLEQDHDSKKPDLALAGGCAHFLPFQPQWAGYVHVFLGLEGEKALFAVALPGDTPPAFPGATFEETRAAAAVLPPRDCALVAQARSLLNWHEMHGFCARCGAPTKVEDGGYRRHCPACKTDHFPRTDPVVIMLPILKGAHKDEDRCLVGHNVRFAEKYYSAFAGFVEPGETVEQAVARELAEEVSLAVGAVTYHASQPWPFPSALMIGCYTQALSDAFTVDGGEIADAHWMRRDEVLAHLGGQAPDGVRLPNPIAIAHRLIRDWAEDQGIASLYGCAG